MTTNTKIYRAIQSTKKHKLSKFNLIELTECIFAFLLNNISLASSISPFGIAYFAATYPKQRTSLSIITAFFGILLSGFGVMSLKYIGTLSIFLIITLLFGEKFTEKNLFSAFSAAFSLYLAGMVFVISDGFLLYDLMLLSFESIVAFFCVLVFCKASAILRSIKETHIFDTQEILTVVFLLSVACFSIISVPQTESIGYTLCVYIILFVAYTKGFELSCGVGVIVGAVCASVSVLPQQIFCIYVVSSLFAGVCRQFGKLGVCLGFLLSSSLSMLFLNSLSIYLLPFICTFIASLMLFLTPSSAFKFFDMIKNVQPHFTSNLQEEFCAKIASEKIEGLSSAFGETSDIFSSLIAKQTKEKITNPGLIFDSAKEDICRTCSKCIKCWDVNYDKTAKEMSEMFRSMNDKGYAIEFDAPCDFRENCIHFDDFLASVNENYKLHKNNLMWASKVYESRALIPEQFSSIASALKRISATVASGIKCDTAATKKLLLSLSKKGYDVVEGYVMYNDCCAASIIINGTSEKRDLNIIASLASAACEVPLFCSKFIQHDKTFEIKLIEKSNYSADIGFAEISATGEKKCGDSHIFMPLANGKYLLALSDGMGSGEKARTQSKTTIELIKMLLECGFDKETTLKLINTILLLKSPSETYATVDLCILNTFTGALEFIKNGAARSYLKTSNSIIKIGCHALPVGAVYSAQPDCELIYVKNGDFIVMITDGISDLLESDESSDLENIIKNKKYSCAQELAEEIINAASEKSGKSPHDDMTVMVAAIKSDM